MCLVLVSMKFLKSHLFWQEELIASTKELLLCIESGDYDVYKKLCDPALTAFEPEAQGQLKLFFSCSLKDEC